MSSDTQSEKTKEFGKWLTEIRSKCLAALDMFRKRLEVEPIRAFDDCDGAIETAAMLSIADYVLCDLEAGATLNDIRKEALAKMLDIARTPPASSSHTANLFKTYKAKAWGNIFHAVEWRFR